jgi:hypothetical protein
MTDAMTWTVIGGFFAVFTFLAAMVLRVIRTDIGRLDYKIDAVEARLDAKIDGVELRLGGKIDALDRDMQTVINRLMGGNA